MNQFLILAGLLAVVGFHSANAAAPPPSAKTEPAVTWFPLELSRPGKTGFTRLPAEQTGLVFTNTLAEAASAANRVLENGSGVAAGDSDRDGRPDLFFCSLEGRCALYRNQGGWRFEDITAKAGIQCGGRICRGAVFADVNGDGWLDLLISTLGQGVLCFLNDGTGRFREATQEAGTATRFGSTTLALADIDGNGTLDLYVTNYRADDIRDRSRVEVQVVNGQMVLGPQYRDRLILLKGGLMEFGEPDVLYLNDGQGHFHAASWTDGTFRNETGQGLGQAPRDWGLTATFRDLDGDGCPDLYVCNDYWTPDRLWLNDGHGHFRLISPLAIRHTSENSMGVDVADIDRDGKPDLFVLDMLSRDPRLRKHQASARTLMRAASGEFTDRPQLMRNTLFWNRGDGSFAEIASFCGLAASDWSWQPRFLDVDLDGYEDLIISAGHQRDVQDLDATLKIQSLQHPWPKDMGAQERQAAFTREMMEHARLYPPLPMPLVAYRNEGNLRFTETTSAWGTDDPGVHQGLAGADFDGDGDLDLVVNNLNGRCGIYRNDSVAARVAVRLEGLPPNTQAVGARASLLHGAVPRQDQEIVSGGRYSSGCDPLLVFAAGSNSSQMAIEIKWRSGRMTQVPNVVANRLYVIREQVSAPASAPSNAAAEPTPVPPLFEDVSERLKHQHAENGFDDAARQPLLPKQMSRLGPGIAWFDLDGDGRDDLIIGSGLGGRLGVFHNQGNGQFTALSDPGWAAPVTRDQTTILAWRKPDGETAVLAGASNYEDGSALSSSVDQYTLGSHRLDANFPGGAASTGPLALGDLRGDGNLELLVGGRVLPGRYPQPAPARLFAWDQGAWKLDAANSQPLEKAGLVSGAVWSDLDGDGFPELILACEWGPVRIFQNHAGRLREATAEWGMAPYTGWWAGVTTGDLDGDGRLDIVAANWGLNSPYAASPEHPLALYYGDFNGQGNIDLVECEYDPIHRQVAPRHRLDYLAAGLPFLRERFSSYRAFAEASIDQVLGDRSSRAALVQARTLASMVFLNRGRRFEGIDLPAEAQFAPAYAVNVADLDGDGSEDVFLGQNFFDVPWEFPRQDAGLGLFLKGDGIGRLEPIAARDSGIRIFGEQRGAAVGDFDEDGRIDLAVTQNGAETKLYRNTQAKPGLRVRLAGPRGNATGIGAVMQLRFGDRWGPAREIHAGSGYWSQDGPVQVLGALTPPTQILIRWPGGKTTTTPVPGTAHEITVEPTGRLVSWR